MNNAECKMKNEKSNMDWDLGFILFPFIAYLV